MLIWLTCSPATVFPITEPLPAILNISSPLLSMMNSMPTGVRSESAIRAIATDMGVALGVIEGVSVGLGLGDADGDGMISVLMSATVWGVGIVVGKLVTVGAAVNVLLAVCVTPIQF